MIHIGAIIGQGVSQVREYPARQCERNEFFQSGSLVCVYWWQGKSQLWGIQLYKFEDFRNHKEKRDFVACGAAAVRPHILWGGGQSP
jgi:hypothetical protein